MGFTDKGFYEFCTLAELANTQHGYPFAAQWGDGTSMMRKIGMSMGSGLGRSGRSLDSIR